MNIRNVSDRERQLCAEIDALKTYVEALEPDAKYWRTAKALNWIEPGLEKKLDAAMKEGAK